MVREQHRLGVLRWRVAGQDDVEVRLGLPDERLAQRHVRRHEVLAALLGEQARVGGHLVVAAAAGVQARPSPMSAMSARSTDMWMSSSLMSNAESPASMRAFTRSEPSTMASTSAGR